MSRNIKENISKKVGDNKEPEYKCTGILMKVSEPVPNKQQWNEQYRQANDRSREVLNASPKEKIKK